MVPTKSVGVPGTDAVGVAVVVADAAPSPFEFRAFICTLYEVPLTSAVVPSLLTVEITIGDPVVPEARLLNVTPPSVEYL